MASNTRSAKDAAKRKTSKTVAQQLGSDDGDAAMDTNSETDHSEPVAPSAKRQKQDQGLQPSAGQDDQVEAQAEDVASHSLPQTEMVHNLFVATKALLENCRKTETRIRRGEKNQLQSKKKLDDLDAKFQTAKQEQKKNAGELTLTKKRLVDLESENLDLKRAIGTTPRPKSQCTDDILISNMSKLNQNVAGWVSSVLRKPGTEALQTSPPYIAAKATSRILPSYQDAHCIRLSFFLQAIVMSEMRSAFDFSLSSCAPFDQVDEMASSLEKLLAAESSNQTASGSPDINDCVINAWRWEAFGLFSRVPTAKQIAMIEGASKNTADDVFKVIGGLISLPDDPDRFADLQKITKLAIMMALKFKSQRAKYHFDFIGMPLDKTKTFDPDTMDDEYGDDKPELQGKRVALALSPAIIKYGNDEGKDLSSKQFICKARVVCGDDEQLSVPTQSTLPAASSISEPSVPPEAADEVSKTTQLDSMPESGAKSETGKSVSVHTDGSDLQQSDYTPVLEKPASLHINPKTSLSVLISHAPCQAHSHQGEATNTASNNTQSQSLQTPSRQTQQPKIQDHILQPVQPGALVHQAQLPPTEGDRRKRKRSPSQPSEAKEASRAASDGKAASSGAEKDVRDVDPVPASESGGDGATQNKPEGRLMEYTPHVKQEPL